MLQEPLHGLELQLLFDVRHGLWRCRCALVRGFKCHGTADLTLHLKALIDHPWLHGAPTELTKAEKLGVPVLTENELLQLLDITDAPSLPTDNEQLGLL